MLQERKLSCIDLNLCKQKQFGDFIAKVHVKNDGQTVEVPDGSQLEYLDGRSSVLFACKSATCGSCMVKVLEGEGNLEQPNELEAAGLQAFSSDPTQRLMCQCKIKKGEITIEY